MVAGLWAPLRCGDLGVDRSVYLNCVLQLGVLVVEDAEAERLLWNHLHKHEVATLQRGARWVRHTWARHQPPPYLTPGPACRPVRTHQDVSFVGKRVISLLCDEKQLVQEEECPLILGPLDAEGPLKHQLPVAGEVWPLPVG